jgi:hypothetical protein
MDPGRVSVPHTSRETASAEQKRKAVAAIAVRKV